MVGDLNLFAENDKGFSFLKKLCAPEHILPIDGIKGCILEQSIPGDVIYVQYCHLTPVAIHKEIANRCVTYFEPREIVYKVLRILSNCDADLNKQIDKFWREFQPVLRQKELEGAFLPNAHKRDFNYTLNRSETLQFLNNREVGGSIIADAPTEIIEWLRDILHFILNFTRNMFDNEKRSFVDKADIVFRYIQEIRENLIDYSTNLIVNEDIQSKKRRKANFILILPFIGEDLQKFGPRIKYQDTMARIFNLYADYLTRSGKMALIMPNKKYYPELIYQEAEKEGWFFDSLKETNDLHGSYLYYTFVKQNQNPISGSLKRLQKVNLFDFEKEIIKEIEVFLQENNVASLQEIREHLMFNSRSGYPQQPLVEILNEYFPSYKSLYFYGPMPAESKRSRRKSKDVVVELCCRYLLLHKKFVTYDTLFDFISNIKFGSLFSLPYYYAVKKECNQRGFKTPGNLFEATVKDPSALRRLLLKLDEFFEPFPYKYIGLLLLEAEININNFRQLMSNYSNASCSDTLEIIKIQLHQYLDKVLISPEEKETLMADIAFWEKFKISNQI